MSSTFTQGEVPTAAQWNAAFASKQPLLTYAPLNSAGGTMTGLLTAAASTSSSSGFNLTPGVAPTTPNNGDLWTTGSGIFVELSGTTYQLATGTAGAAILNANNTFTGSNTFQGTTTFLGTISGLTQPLLLLNPQGRITLTSGSAVMINSVTSGSDIWYTPYNGSSVPIYNGTAMQNYQFTSSGTDRIGLHIPLTGGTASWPVNKLFDVFATLNGTAVALITGPAWTNSTTRSGTLTYYSGFLVNGSAITGRTGSATTVAIGQFGATYLGTVLTNTGTAAVVSFVYGISGAGGGSGAFLNVYNYYNRINIGTVVTDSNSYTYSGTAVRAADNSVGNRISFVQGVAEDSATANYQGYINPIGNTTNGIGLDGTTTYSVFSSISSIAQTSTSYYQIPAQTGSHFIQALEASPGGGTSTFGGNGNTTNFNALAFSLNM